MADAASASGSVRARAGATGKEKTFFWQYNTQAKGPKGKRLCHVVEDDDPYVLHDFEDPVFDSELLVNTHLSGLLLDYL